MSINSIAEKFKKIQEIKEEMEKNNNWILEGVLQFSKELQEGLNNMNFELYAVKTINIKKEIGTILLVDNNVNMSNSNSNSDNDINSDSESQSKKKCQKIQKILLHDTINTDDVAIYQTTSQAIQNLVSCKLDNLSTKFNLDTGTIEVVRQQGNAIVDQVMTKFAETKNSHNAFKQSIIHILQDDNLDFATKLDKITNFAI
jgi:hypothetical protein